MTGRAIKPGKIETDIERLRVESNWARLFDISKQLPSKNPQFEQLGKFIKSESKLERYFIDNPLIDSNSSTNSSTELINLEKEFLDLRHNEMKPDMKHETLMLLAKISFAMGNHIKVLDLYDEIKLDQMLLNDISSRKLKLIGEAFAIKGFCIEKLPLDGSLIEREEQVMECFEKSGDISLFQLQDKQVATTGTLKTNMPNPASMAASTASGLNSMVDMDNCSLTPIVDNAILRSPVIRIRNGDLQKGIGRFRELLRIVESKSTQTLRMNLARQLAEVLMRGVCKSTYRSVNIENQNESSILKIRKYHGDGIFSPSDESEETILLLLIAESIASKDVVYNRSVEFASARVHSLQRATEVFDLLTIALVRRAQFSVLTDTFEKALKFSYEEFHLWFQFALLLICSQKYSRAYLVLKECMRLKCEDLSTIYMLAIKLAYEHLHLVGEGISYSEKLIETIDQEEHILLAAKGYLYLGIGYSLKVDELKMLSERKVYHRKAIDTLRKSISLDSNDHLSYFHLAFQLALIRQIPDALVQIRASLDLQRDHLQSLHLLALLLTSQKQYVEAAKLIDATLMEYPHNFSLLFTKCKLLSDMGSLEPALQTCKLMLQLWKKNFEFPFEREERGTGLLDRVTADNKNLMHLQLFDAPDMETRSVRAESVAASRLEQALSEAASSMGSYMQPKPGPQHAWMLQAQIWLKLAELYLSLDRLESANACIQEAGLLYPMSHVVSHMRGRYYEAKGDLLEARKVYENAVSINPVHIKSLLRLGIVLHKLNNNRLAEKTLRNAVTCDPTSSDVWRALGKVLDSLGDFEHSTECLMTSLELEHTDPILPFSVVQKVCS